MSLCVFVEVDKKVCVCSFIVSFHNPGNDRRYLDLDLDIAWFYWVVFNIIRFEFTSDHISMGKIQYMQVLDKVFPGVIY